MGMLMLLCCILLDGFVIVKRYIHPWVVWCASSHSLARSFDQFTLRTHSLIHFSYSCTLLIQSLYSLTHSLNAGWLCCCQELNPPLGRLVCLPSLTHPLTHPPTHPLTHSLTHSLTHYSLTHSLTHSLHSLLTTHSLLHLLTHLSYHSVPIRSLLNAFASVSCHCQLLDKTLLCQPSCPEHLQGILLSLRCSVRCRCLSCLLCARAAQPDDDQLDACFECMAMIS